MKCRSGHSQFLPFTAVIFGHFRDGRDHRGCDDRPASFQHPPRSSAILASSITVFSFKLPVSGNFCVFLCLTWQFSIQVASRIQLKLAAAQRLILWPRSFGRRPQGCDYISSVLAFFKTAFPCYIWPPSLGQLLWAISGSSFQALPCPTAAHENTVASSQTGIFCAAKPARRWSVRLPCRICEQNFCQLTDSGCSAGSFDQLFLSERPWCRNKSTATVDLHAANSCLSADGSSITSRAILSSDLNQYHLPAAGPPTRMTPIAHPWM